MDNTTETAAEAGRLETDNISPESSDTRPVNNYQIEGTQQVVGDLVRDRSVREVSGFDTGSRPSSVDVSGTISNIMQRALIEFELQSQIWSQESVSLTGQPLGSTTAADEQEYSFGPARREEMMQQMIMDIDHYCQLREQAFEDEHGYGMYFHESIPEPENLVEDGSFRASTPSLITNVDIESETTGRPPTWRREEVDEALLRQRTSRWSPPFERLFPRNLIASPLDCTEDFFHSLVLDTSRSYVPDEQDQFYLNTPGRNLHARHSLVHTSGQFQVWNLEDPQQTIEVLNLFIRRILLANDGGPTLKDIMRRAVDDGMDLGESLAYAIAWNNFRLSTGQMNRFYSSIGRRAVLMSVLQFWVALRRGWGGWRPSDFMIRGVRDMLLRQTSFRHQVVIQERTPTELLALGRQLLDRLEATLPGYERDRFDSLFLTLELDRFSSILDNWLEFCEQAAETRTSSENHLTTEQISLDRLERLIWEERVVNARRTPRGEPIDSEYTRPLLPRLQ